MTLIVALKCVDGIVIAADSRSTIGDPRGLTAMNDTATKLFKLNESCAVAVSGAGELAFNLVDSIQRELANRKYSVDRYAQEAGKKFRQQYAEWFKDMHAEARPAVNFIMVGLEKLNDIPTPRTYLLTSQTNFALQLAIDGCMLAGIVNYGVYLKHRFYDPSMGIAQALRLAIYLITETATQDPKVGGPIRAAKLTSEGYVQLTDSEIDGVIEENNQQNAALKKFFMR